MTAGRVHPHEGGTKAECANCDWEIESTKAGEAAHKLMEHNVEEHSR